MSDELAGDRPGTRSLANLDSRHVAPEGTSHDGKLWQTRTPCKALLSD
jgi:hypothetical protein